MANVNAVYVRGHAKPRPGPRKCQRCGAETTVDSYVAHVKRCLAGQMVRWEAEEYSKRYFAQVRAISRFRKGGIKQRSLFKSWAWWAVKPDGPALTRAEVSG